MKKFTIALILIIPFIIVFSLFATSTVIAETMNVNATSVAVYDANGDEITYDLELDITETNCMVYIKVLPTITYDPSVTFELDATISTGAVDIAKAEDDGWYTVTPTAVGVARVIVSASNNTSVNTILTIIVTSKILEKVTLYSTTDGSVQSGTIELISPTTLATDFYPTSAINSGIVVWESSNTDIFTVSDSGLISPVSAGVATLSVATDDRAGNILATTIAIDTTNALINTTTIYAASSVDAKFIAENVVINSSATVSGSGSAFTVTYGKYSAIVYVEYCEAGAWGFINLATSAYTNNGAYYIGVGFKDYNYINSELSYSISVENVSGSAYISGDYLYPVSAGTILITATANNEIVTAYIEIKERPAYITLMLNEEDQCLGIEQVHIFATNFYSGTTFTNTLQFGLQNSTVWANSNISFVSSNTAVATIDETGFITILSHGTFTITATVMLGEYSTTTTASYTFSVIEDEAVNIYSLDEFMEALANNVDMVLQTDIYLEERIELYSSIYGNGFTISTEFVSDVSRYALMISIIDESGETITLQNTVFEGCSSYADSAEMGLGIYIKTVSTEVIINYCIVRYYNCGIEINSGSDVYLQGCVLGDCNFLGVQINNDYNYCGDITFENIIFKETTGPSILMMNETMSSDGYSENIVPNITIKGFFESYNWKTTSEIKDMLSEINPNTLGMIADFVDIEALMSFLGVIVEDVFLRDDMSHLSYIADDGIRYISAAMVAIGVYNFIDTTQFTIEDDGLALLEIPMPTDNSDIGIYLQLAEIGAKLVSNKLTVYNSSYMLSYTIEDNTPRCMPNDPVPENAELYARLVG
ncbi:MAG: hypothetical protein R3Y23_03825 [Bacillota bacterium]